MSGSPVFISASSANDPKRYVVFLGSAPILKTSASARVLKIKVFLFIILLFSFDYTPKIALNNDSERTCLIRKRPQELVRLLRS